jgi:regulator of protease activity HflC (stomatin/prohibitin superfamily)
MRTPSPFAALIFFVILAVGGGLAFAAYSAAAPEKSIGIGVIAFVIAIVSGRAIRDADQWDKAVILRIAQFHSLKGPGLFFINPIVDAIP